MPCKEHFKEQFNIDIEGDTIFQDNFEDIIFQENAFQDEPFQEEEEELTFGQKVCMLFEDKRYFEIIKLIKNGDLSIYENVIDDIKPIFLAVESCNIPLTRYILKLDKNFETFKKEDYEYLIDPVIYYGDIKMVKCLLEFGLDIENEAMKLAIKYKQTQIINYLNNRKANPIIKTLKRIFLG